MKRQFLPIEVLPAWARLNGVTFHGVAFEKLFGSSSVSDVAEDKGSAVIAKEEKYNGDLESDDGEKGENPRAEILIRVPPDLVLSLGFVEDCAKADRYLRDVLEAVGEFGRTARGAILIFLLLHITYTASRTVESPRKQIGVSNAWSEYIKFLPERILLPTFYTEEERGLLYGTSLREAVDTKLVSLEREFEHLRNSTQSIPWCLQEWWEIETGALTFDDWKLVDAMYRSRALDLPGTGHAMVPCVDMANHASGDATVALYETDEQDNAVLQLRWGKKLHPGEEVTITYGDDKGASEMIFSYGFLESSVTNAHQIFLDLDMPDDDPLKPAKKAVCKDAPGVRIFFHQSGDMTTGWESPFVWWACVNEEDGLDFELLQTSDGGRELRAAWKGKGIGHIRSSSSADGDGESGNISASSSLQDTLRTDPQWEIFQLRAVVLLQSRLETQLGMLEETEEAFDGVEHDPDGTKTGVRSEIYATIGKLRILEMDLLRRGVKDLAATQEELLSLETVKKYLGIGAGHGQAEEEDDFS